MICHSWFIQPQFIVIYEQLKDRMNLENELKAVIHNRGLLGFQTFCHSFCHFLTIIAC